MGVLLISSVTAETENEEALDADVEVEDFDKQSQEADVDREISSLEVRLQKSLVNPCFIVNYIGVTSREIDRQMHLKKSKLICS